ncbi:DNA topoisomerase I [Nonlabens sp. Hel1_33_55]|uniref:type I DNA topoisomerase n=1 Tax=Nonlabens sp. Hel1_33_55 TaxID=1336802 RepID=UPI000875DD01|nr:type I DNA topoisomerase [Nonlabens sp. Hel1_33_55]SCY24899.1 DNA topoisomerase I [Nonlabens sp. Hel1_33_55]
MAKNLVIVESPAKAKTIEKFLGKDYKVASSFGHIADLPAKELGVAVDKDFEPKYIVSSDKKDLVKKLKKMAAESDMVWLASDEDREGEAIAWHLAEQLDLKKEKTKRIVFNAITKSAVQNAIDNPRDIDYDLVNAQQARRVLDRIVGYEISPILWRKVKGGASAGRVQSVAVRLIVEREQEIHDFEGDNFYRVDADFATADKKSLKAKLPSNLSSRKEAEDFLEQNKGAKFHVADLVKKPAKKSPAPPFTTSTLQQEASRKLSFNVSRTMQLAQRLYEAGLITYMRTDSVNLSKEAKTGAQDEILKAYGKDFHKERNYKGKSKGAQEAHEAIRPTDFNLHSSGADRDQTRLYELIWKRAIASQMSDAQLERTNVTIAADKHDKNFTASGEIVKFEGFLKVYLESTDDEDLEQEGLLPPLKKGQALTNKKITATERFSRPPYRYSEASLVKKLEELGIGRPSTYAPTITTVQNRKYVEKGQSTGEERAYVQLVLKDSKVVEKELSETTGSNKGKLVPTDVGRVVNDFLVAHFENILDYNFTAKVEESFDNIAEGKEQWTDMMDHFYKKFHPTVTDVAENAEREVGERVLGKDPKTGKPISVRLGRFGAMAQIGTVEDEEKPQFASLLPSQSLNTITLEEVMDLFKLPRTVGEYNGHPVEVNQGRFGPYVKFNEKTFVSLEDGDDPMTLTFERAGELIAAKEKADAPIYMYDEQPVTKGVGRFGPYIKWAGMFISVNKKYDFDNLTNDDIETLIKDKIQKEKDKLIVDWEEEGIRIEKARWGRHNVIKGKTKVELAKTIDPLKITLEEAKEMIAKKAPKKKAAAKKKTTAKKKAPAKKKTASAKAKKK